MSSFIFLVSLGKSILVPCCIQFSTAWLTRFKFSVFLIYFFFSLFDHVFLIASNEPSVEMENEEKIRQEARRRLEEQLKQYRAQRHTERVSQQMRTVTFCQMTDIEVND